MVQTSRNPAAIARAARAARATAVLARAARINAAKAKAVRSVTRAPPRTVRTRAVPKAVPRSAVRKPVTVKKVATTKSGAKVYRAFTPHWKYRNGGTHKWQKVKGTSNPNTQRSAPRKGCGCGKKIR